MTTVKDVMSKDVQFQPPDATLRDVASCMRDHDVGAVPIRDGKNGVAGLVTDRDIVLRALADDGRDPDRTRAEEIMSSPVASVGRDDDVKDALSQMRQRRIRRLLVKDDHDEIVGVVSLGDLSRSDIPEKDRSEAYEGICAGC